MTAQVYARVLGTGGYLPEKVLDNCALEKMVETSDEWIFARTGIRERRLVADGESVCDMAEVASRRALEVAGVSPEAVDLIVVATTTPDLVFPSTACLLQGRLGSKGGPAFDVQAVCAGFVYAMDLANRFIRMGSARTALVVGSDAMSRILDWQDRGTCILFGDGAGAVVLGASDQPGVLSTHLHADGSHKDLLCTTTGPGNPDRTSPPVIHMQGNSVFKMAVRTLGDVVEEVLAENNLTGVDIDWLVPHQANIRIIQATADKLGLPMERVVVTIDRHGNTSGASIPLALDEAVRQGRITEGQNVLMEAFGGGFAWGGVLLRWG